MDNTHESLDSKLDTKVDSKDPEYVVGVDEVDEDDSSYTELRGWRKFYRGTLFQMIVLGALSFTGPSMDDAIGGLGGGGLSTPYLSNAANAAGYATSALVAFFGGPLINQIGIRNACILAAVCFWLPGSGYLINLKYGTFGSEIWLLISKIISGLFSACLYVGEATAMLSYPLPHQRGLYLSIWVGMRNAGSLVGGIISLANNSKNAGEGAVSIGTYVCFIAFECLGAFIAFLLSHQSKVRRSDGSKVAQTAKVSWGREIKLLFRHLRLRRTVVMIIPYMYSFWYGGTTSTYLSLHFSVRARALSSFITPLGCIITTGLFGILLDSRRFSQRTRGYICAACWLIPQIAGFIWLGMNMSWFGHRAKALALDYTNSHWAVSYLPYYIIQLSGYWTQCYMYWCLGCFSTDTAANSRSGGLFRSFETMGQAISYSINSRSGNKLIPLYINAALLVLTVPCQFILIRMIPDVPAEVDEVEFEAEHPAATAVVAPH